MKKLLPMTAIFATLACSGEGDVDRTQTNKVQKAVFQGTWYVGATVTEVPATSASTFVGDQSGIEKIVWDIQEDYLIGYRAYEEVPGSDPRVDYGTGEATVRPGQGEGVEPTILRENPLVVFQIEKHFDVKRDYNASTGEQTNIILENDTDRPWFERDWMRVDWGQNLLAQGGATSFSFTAPGKAQVVFWHQMAEGSEDSIRWIDDVGACVNFDGRKGGQWARDNCVAHQDAGAVTYFDMVSELLLTPDVDADGNPLCLLPDMFPATCGATRVKARTAFMRVGRTEDMPIAEGSLQTQRVVTTAPREHEPVVYTDRMLGKFGFFRVERQTYDRGYETTETGRVYLAAIHSIWKDVWQKTDGVIIRDELTGQPMTIPVADREPRPIVYHLSPHFRPELIPTMEDVADGWNRAFRQAVALAKDISFTDIDDVDETDVPRMFVVNYNGWVCDGVWDHGTCDGEISYDEAQQVARVGDLRYNLIALVDALQLTSPFGYGPSLADPETGEIISGRAYVYGAVLDRQAQAALDIVKFLNGDLVDADFPSGDYVREYVEKNLNPIDPRNIPAALNQITLDRDGFERLLGSRLPEVQNFIGEVQSKGLTEALPRVERDWYQQRFEKILGTSFESQLMTDEMRAELAGPALGWEWTPGTAIPDDVKEFTNINRWLSPKAFERTRWRINYASAKSVWLEEFADDSIYGLATELKDTYDGDEDKMRHRLREMILRGVMEHEVGHTLGLRHNFAGSYDSLNYDDRYWEMKQESFQALGKVTPATASDDFSEVYELNAMTENQKAGRMREFQFSTTMDYGAAFNTDVHGLGKYDMAAIAFGYGGAVEVFDETKVDEDKLETLKLIMRSRFHSRFDTGQKCLMRFDDRRAPFYPMLTEEYHYTTVADMVGVTPEDVSPLQARRWMKWSDLKPQHDTAYQACLDYVNSDPNPDKDFNEYIDDRDLTYTEMDRPLEFPYAFCGDEYAETTMSCHRWDEGADGLEIAQRGAANYNAYYFFRTYRNDRFPFASSTYLSGLTGRTLFILPTVYQNWLTELSFNDGAVDFVQIIATTMGMQLGFDTLTGILTRPNYGKYEYFPANQMFLRTDSDPDSPAVPDTELMIPRGAGRRYSALYDYTDHGYFYNGHIQEHAHYWDIQAALGMLTGATTQIAGVDVEAEGFIYLTPYESIFGDELFQLFSGIWSGQPRLYAGRVDVDVDITDPAKCQTLPGCYLDRPIASFVEREFNSPYIDPRDLKVWPPLVAGEPEGEPINPGLPLIVQQWTLETGMAAFGFGRYFDFQDSNLVWLKTGEQPALAAGWEEMTCQDPRVFNGQTWVTKRKIDGSVDDRPSVLWMARCQTAQQAVEIATYGTPGYVSASGQFDGVVWRLDWMRGLNTLYGHTF